MAKRQKEKPIPIVEPSTSDIVEETAAKTNTYEIEYPFGRHLLRVDHTEIAIQLSPEEVKQKVNLLKATFAEINQEIASQKMAKDDMKARMSKLLSKQQDLIKTISTGEEIRQVEVEIYLAGDGTVVQEVEKGTGKLLNVRPPRPGENAPELFPPEAGEE